MKATLSILLALAASSTAMPRPPGYVEPDPYLRTVDELCKRGEDLKTPEGAYLTWHSTFASISLGKFVTDINNIDTRQADWEGQKDWLINLEDHMSNGYSGKTGTDTCASLGSGVCNPMNGMTCPEYFEKAPEGDRFRKSAYWIFEAVKGMHSKFDMIDTELTANTIVADLQIDDIINAFNGGDSGAGDILSWLSAAAAMGSTLTGLAPGGQVVSDGLDVMSTIFSLGAEAAADEFDRGSLRSSLGTLFKVARDSLARTLRIATGGGTSEEEFNSLAGPGADKRFTPLEHFFRSGWFLLHENSDAVRETVSAMSSNIVAKVANNVMNESGMRLVADLDRGNSDDCYKQGNGHEWLEFEGRWYCFRLMTPGSGQHLGHWFRAAPEIYESMDKFNLGNRAAFYLANADCAKHGGDVQWEVVPNNIHAGSIPRCYFNIPTYVYRHDNGDCFSTSLLNPANLCNPHKLAPFSHGEV